MSFFFNNSIVNFFVFDCESRAAGYMLALLHREPVGHNNDDCATHGHNDQAPGLFAAVLGTLQDAQLVHPLRLGDILFPHLF